MQAKERHQASGTEQDGCHFSSRPGGRLLFDDDSGCFESEHPRQVQIQLCVADSILSSIPVRPVRRLLPRPQPPSRARRGCSLRSTSAAAVRYRRAPDAARLRKRSCPACPSGKQRSEPHDSGQLLRSENGLDLVVRHPGLRRAIPPMVNMAVGRVFCGHAGYGKSDATGLSTIAASAKRSLLHLP